MPEYGLCDKSPEELEDERFKQELFDAVKKEWIAEAAAMQRGVDAENSSIQTAEILRHMTDQIQELQDAQKTERQTRMASEKLQEKKDHRNLKIAIVSCIASVIAALVGIIAFFR